MLNLAQRSTLPRVPHHRFHRRAASNGAIALATSESRRSRRADAGRMIAFAARGRRARSRARLRNGHVFDHADEAAGIVFASRGVDAPAIPSATRRWRQLWLRDPGLGDRRRRERISAAR
jgi:hypothetical protein